MPTYLIVKDHLEKYKEGQTVTLDTDQGNYLIAQGVARGAKGKVDSPALKQAIEQEEEAQKENEAREREAAAPAKKSATPRKK